MLARLTPSSERGDVIAAGAVVITTFTALFAVRFGGAWAAGPRLLVVGAIAVLIGTLALLAPVEGDNPRPYQSVLYVADFLLTLLMLAELADVFGADGAGSGTIVWVGLVLIGLAGFYALTRGSAIMTLFGAATAVVVVISFFDWIADIGVQTERWLLLLCSIALVLGAVALRDLNRRHAVSLVDVVGLSIVALGVSLAAAGLVSGLTAGLLGGGSANGPAGWEFVLLVFGFGLIAYGAVDRERVPMFLGAVVLVLFVAVAGFQSEASLLWWPIFLLLAGGGLLALGLRPAGPLPPEPPVPPRAGGAGGPDYPPTEPTAVAE